MMPMGSYSLLPGRSWKLAIMKQWFELSVERPASQFSWLWWQRLVEYKLVLALSLINRLASEIIVGIHWHPLG